MADTSRESDIETRVQQLLADPAQAGNPLHTALLDLWGLHQETLARIERVTRMPDAYQGVTRRRETSVSERMEKQLRQLSKVARISDRYQDMMRELNQALKEASTHDPMTGLPNRRLLLDRLKEEHERSQRHGGALTVAMVDIDKFKRFNDEFGHDVGDKVIVAVSHTMKEVMRGSDMCGRWGGEEFLVVLPETTLEMGATFIDRLCQDIRKLQIPSEGQMLSVTVSVGIATLKPGESYSDAVNRADAALYVAKRGGRDRYELAA
ncbi:MAG: biofilm regulation diguanylate cyclase SiaD [Pseudomonadota bacterium]